jgi:hypothetical protein
MARAQLQIEGTAAPVIEEIEAAAEEYRVLRDERMQLGEKETKAQAALVAVMVSHNLTSYRYEDGEGNQRKVSLAEVVKAKVGKVKDTGDGGSDDN